ncbi:hypothetical protein N749_16530 [Legionella pneumophila str. Leg01/20]|nr:hypothetical protein N749_16530 [Legionella pneumophila str. Leg01/20]
MYLFKHFWDPFIKSSREVFKEIFGWVFIVWDILRLSAFISLYFTERRF